MYMLGVSIFFALSCYCGLLVYATYHDCDPISTQVVTTEDQLFPLLVTRVFRGVDGLPGIFIAGVFSSSLRYSRLHLRINTYS
uniref:Uncharacterized protein n=1 Tax=Timema shepardi TaxID=629360 RepID=A0A7R9BC11_TIMSH|nr:unnamed protein product [Timema shepardi]